MSVVSPPVRPAAALLVLTVLTVLTMLTMTACGGGGGDAEVPSDPAAARGRELTVQLGCTACHSPGTGDVIGPAWGGSWGTTVELADGSTAVFDAAYVENSVRTPGDQRRAGDWIQMPAYPEGLLADDDLADIVAYLESLSSP